MSRHNTERCGVLQAALSLFGKVFLFAQPPLGDLRFRAPKAPGPWTGVRDATTFGLASAQSGGMMQRIFSATPEPSGEDCLFLTINYRLGALGFLHLADLGGKENDLASNCGLFDQIAALEWVRDNIAAFGGDPNNITIFGESAGAMSIGTLLAMPAAKGLFQKAILQSGASHTIQDSAGATRIAKKLMDTLDIRDVTELLGVSGERLLAVQNKVSGEGGRLAYAPVIDGVTLPHQPTQATPDRTILERLFGSKAEEVAAIYEAHQPEHSSSYAWIDFLTDRSFRIPAIRLAECQSALGANVWMYRFDWPTPVFGGNLKACHGLEIPFVWNNLDKHGVNMLTGDDPTRQKVADAMHLPWIMFARSGNPNSSGLRQWSAYNGGREFSEQPMVGLKISAQNERYVSASFAIERDN